MTNRWLLAVVLTAILVGGAAPALGEGTAVDTGRFRPASAAEGGVLLEGPALGPAWEVDATLWLHGSYRPVVLTVNGEATQPLVDGRIGGTLHGGVNFGRRVRLALDLPVTLYQAGTDPLSSEPLAVGGIGDLRVLPQVMILDPESDWLGLALSSPISFPTGREDALLGESGPTIQPRIHAEKRFAVDSHRWLRFAATVEAGWRFRPRTRLLDLDSAGEFTVGVGARWEPSASFRLGTEIVADIGSGPNARRGEWVSWARVTPGPAGRFDVIGGLAVGLGRGVGTPEGRVFGAVRVRLDPRPRPRVGRSAERTSGPPTEPAWAEQDEPPFPGESEGSAWGLRLVGRTARIDSSVLFKLDSATLTQEGRVVVAELAGWLVRHRSAGSLEIAGHCDERGSVAYNQTLSERRANAVVDHLVLEGVAPDRLVARGYGENRPILKPGSASLEDVWRANRRVELRFVKRPRSDRDATLTSSLSRPGR